jgi:hypothetical protein
MKTLPVYRLVPPTRLRADRLKDLAKKLFDEENFSVAEINGRSLLKTPTKLIDIDIQTGALWAADLAQLWNLEAKPNLPDKEKARSTADDFAKKNNLLPTADSRFVFEPLDAAGSFVSIFDTMTRKREDRQLDFRVNYGLRLIVEDPVRGGEIRVPVIGGPEKIGVTIGDAGKVISYNNSWKPLDSVETKANLISRDDADKQFKGLTSRLKVESFEADLAYSYTRSSDNIEFLCPVWAYRAVSKIGDRKFPLRIITLAATEFGPKPVAAEVQPARSKAPLPRNWETMVKRDIMAIDPYEAGTSWIGSIGGLGGSKKNAQGFVDGLKNAGWKINFNWGDCNAWESDWHANDDYYVDAADIVFYTGHADGNGWLLVDPTTCNWDPLSNTEVGAKLGNPSDMWGQQDLEWMIIAACGPLEDDLISKGGGNAIQRWMGIFDGMHILLGYGAVTYDNEEEGKRFVKYAREGQTIIHAWFRAAQEIQPSTNGYGAPFGPKIYAAAIYAYRSGQISPFNDHLWGYGSVAPDPTSPNVIVCMWVPC